MATDESTATGSQRASARDGRASGKYVRYCLAGLNDNDAGSGLFADLALELCRRRVCSSIVPATQPSAGGDLGQDARSIRVVLDSDREQVLYGSAPVVKERIIFAFSIRQDWRAKVEADAAKAVANNLSPDRVVFVTNQFVAPERVKIEAERDVADAVSTGDRRVDVGILDGAWVLMCLAGDDYDLAVRFLDCPYTEDPQIAEAMRRVFGFDAAGLGPSEVVEVERLRASVRWRHRYEEAPHLLVRQLRRLGDLLSKTDATYEEALSWYKDALQVPCNSRLLAIELVDTYVSYFRALRKVPSGPQEMLARWPGMADAIVSYRLSSRLPEIGIWLLYMVTLRDTPAFSAARARAVGALASYADQPVSPLDEAHRQEALLYLDWLAFGPERDVNAVVERVDRLIGYGEALYPLSLGPLCRLLAVMIPLVPSAEALQQRWERAVEIQVERTGELERAALLRDRAVRHADAGQWAKALEFAAAAKSAWFHEETMRGHLLMSFAMSGYFAELGLHEACMYELMYVLAVTTASTDHDNADMIAPAIAQLARIAAGQGRYLRALRWLCLAWRATATFGDPGQRGTTALTTRRRRLASWRFCACARPTLTVVLSAFRHL